MAAMLSPWEGGQGVPLIESVVAFEPQPEMTLLAYGGGLCALAFLLLP